MEGAAHQVGEPPRVPVAVLEDVPELQHPGREEVDRHHEREAGVEAPEADLDPPLRARPGGVVRERAQAEDEHRQRQHAEDAEERGVAVVAGERGAHLEVGDDRQVDQEAEDPGADEVPEADRHQEVDGPAVTIGHGRLAALAVPVAQADEVPGVEREEGQRDDLQRGEARREAHVERPLAGEVPVVAGPDDAAGQVEDGVEVDDAGGGASRDQSQDHEHHGDEHGGEQLEEALHPQVDDPEAPVVDDREVGAGAEEERGQVEERDGRRRVEEQRGELGPPGVADRRAQGPVHEDQPAREAGRQQQLPEAARGPGTPSPGGRTRTRECPGGR